MCDFYLIDYIADHCLALLHLCFNKKYLSTFFVSSYSMSNVLTVTISTACVECTICCMLSLNLYTADWETGQ